MTFDEFVMIVILAVMVVGGLITLYDDSQQPWWPKQCERRRKLFRKLIRKCMREG